MIAGWPHVRALLADRRGAVLPIVASGILAMAGITALAVDISRAYSAQNELRTAVRASLPLCLLALNPTARGAVHARGSSEIVADDRVVYAN